jgi:glutamyl-tRNA reductase
VNLEQLLVVHGAAPALPGAPGPLPIDGTLPALQVTTCQRALDIHFAAPDELAIDAGRERYRGVEAYRVLLEIATGLRSSIPGETNVFGQLRAAWREYLQAWPHAGRSDFSELIEALFADARTIRTSFLQDIGGHSYGTLTRKLLRAAPGGRVLIVGHGELARSITPLLTGFEVGVINRTRPQRVADQVRHVFDAEEADTALDWADHAVLCVPCHPELDARWLALLLPRSLLQVIHLGCRRSTTGPWSQLRGVLTLDDLFDLRLAQQDRRSRQLELARAACRSRALLRAAESHTTLQLPRGIA